MLRTTLTRLALAGLALAATACSPGAGLPHVGGGALPLDVLAVTEVNAQTGNASYTALLDWPTALNAKIYQVNRKFGENPATLHATLNEPQTEYVDTAGLGAAQTFSYQVRALSGENKELTVSNFVTVGVLAQSVAKPTGLSPANNAQLGVGETPTFTWQPVAGANWYYVTVTSVANNNERVWSALTSDTTARFGAESPLRFSKFGNRFPVGTASSLSPGVVYRWTVQAIRAEGAASPDAAKAIDVNPSAPQTFSQG